MARGGGRGGDGKARGGGGESGMGEKLKVRGEGRRARALRYLEHGVHNRPSERRGDHLPPLGHCQTRGHAVILTVVSHERWQPPRQAGGGCVVR